MSRLFKWFSILVTPQPQPLWRANMMQRPTKIWVCHQKGENFKFSIFLQIFQEFQFFYSNFLVQITVSIAPKAVLAPAHCVQSHHLTINTQDHPHHPLFSSKLGLVKIFDKSHHGFCTVRLVLHPISTSTVPIYSFIKDFQ